MNTNKKDYKMTLENPPRHMRENQVIDTEPLKQRKHMKIREFVDLGLLQEINRQFLHPMGLALVVTHNTDDNSAVISGVWDDTDDPDGTIFSKRILDSDKQKTVEKMFEAKREAREKTFGWHVQPVGVEK